MSIHLNTIVSEPLLCFTHWTRFCKGYSMDCSGFLNGTDKWHGNLPKVNDVFDQFPESQFPRLQERLTLQNTKRFPLTLGKALLLLTWTLTAITSQPLKKLKCSEGREENERYTKNNSLNMNQEHWEYPKRAEGSSPWDSWIH